MVETLGFQLKAENAFSFLAREHGFVITESAPTRLVLESSLVRIFVGFDAGRSFELEVSIGLRSDIAAATSEPPYRLAEVLGSLGMAKRDRFETVQVTTDGAMERFLDLMAKALKVHAQDFIEGDISAFRHVARYRDQECRSYRRDQELARAREVAAAAWAKKNYGDVVRALTPVKDLLSRSDLRRLEIAKKRTSRP